MVLTRQERIAYKMIMPYILAVVLLVAYLLYSNFAISFTGKDGSFHLGHYAEILEDPGFYIILGNTAIWTVFSVAGQMLLGLILALLLNRIRFGQAFFRSIILVLPWATLDIVAGVMWKWMYNDMYGVANDLLSYIPFAPDNVAWLATPAMAKASVIIANVWKGFPLATIFFLARLQGIPSEYYEAAEMDGASTIQQFFNITLPGLKSVMLTTTMLTVIWTINYFPLIFIMTSGGPGQYGTETLVTYIYRLGFRLSEFNEAAATANVLFVIVMLIAGLFLYKITKEDD